MDLIDKIAYQGVKLVRKIKKIKKSEKSPYSDIEKKLMQEEVAQDKTFAEEVRGLFKSWKFTKHCAISQNGEHELWICSGFNSFEDYRGVFLVGFTGVQIKIIWDEMRRERKIRSMENLKKLKDN